MITSTRSRTLALALGAMSLCPAAALAQAWPSKPIRMIVPFPPGGATDFVGRIVGQKLSERLGQQVLIDNRGGANGILGLQALMAAPPDGYTIATVSAGPLAVNPHMYAKLPYDSLRDFTYIANMVNIPLLLVAHPSLPVRNVKDLIALAKARPAEIAEAGVPGYEAYSWTGVIGPANMPRDVLLRLNKEIVEILKLKDISDRLLSEGAVPTPSSSEEFTAYMRSELKKWGDVVKMANIKAD